MFDIGWTELVVIGVVALLVVGPKELPALLRTIGRYMGMVKRQANEFRAQFDEAMRETELDQLRKEVAALKSDAETTLRSAEQSVRSEMADAKSELDNVAAATKADVKADEARVEPAASVGAEAQPAVAAEAQPARINGASANGFGGPAEHAPEAEVDRTIKSGT